MPTKRVLGDATRRLDALQCAIEAPLNSADNVDNQRNEANSPLAVPLPALAIVPSSASVSPTDAALNLNSLISASLSIAATPDQNASLNPPTGCLRNVYLSGFPPYLSSSDFRALCQRFGRVEASKLCVDASTTPTKGYGFALFYTDEAAAACIRGLNNALLCGRCLQARYADPGATPRAATGVHAKESLHPPILPERRRRAIRPGNRLGLGSGGVAGATAAPTGASLSSSSAVGVGARFSTSFPPLPGPAPYCGVVYVPPLTMPIVGPGPCVWMVAQPGYGAGPAPTPLLDPFRAA